MSSNFHASFLDYSDICVNEILKQSVQNHVKIDSERRIFHGEEIYQFISYIYYKNFILTDY